MPFGFGKKEQAEFKTQLTDKDDLDEIKKIADKLDADEEVVVVAKQARVRPGGSLMTPNIIFATDKRLLIRDPTMLGLRESIEDIFYEKITSVRVDKGVFSSSIKLKAPGLSTLSEKRLNWIAFKGASDEGEIEAIPKDKAEKIVLTIKQGMENARKSPESPRQQTSVADELAKLAKLKAEGVISDTEFQALKSDLMSKKP